MLQTHSKKIARSNFFKVPLTDSFRICKIFQRSFMNAKFSEDFLLTTETGKNIYNKYTAGMPVINYYSKMKAKIICENLQFADVAELFICQDEERQNIMRSFRIDEKFITGDASNYEKFQDFVEIIPDLSGTNIFFC